ncbi:hypothetical protein [uncultured Mediterranean phage uvMED]|jgi:hypothetical protein|nr:hypothetical protein HTVC111P_gp28 [Pelagibacter phage HTVC111P]BAQ91025.1 hypothetical protein [uncultured Mediterranean phage uvMED]BAQ91134.1 hypothetical protein [uncultured Mediterranean phage uvMED]BAQ91192.1 hypothetical protein [uncultured Mediterranean phage uvMED]BAQ91230.1 hypothetical protein [uncultured Mediterranean phage uvMED]|tara:strand:+ start:477 stop:695 length:219 start_codon:yes stop_codon:yes gene_type:complete
MLETVVALLMIINGEIKEARIQTSISECLKGSRIAKRNLKPNSNVKYQCVKSEAELELNIDGSKSIKKLILK